MSAVHINLDGDIRASDRTKPATDTTELIGRAGEEVTFFVQLLGHLNHILRAGLDASFAALAARFINNNLWHSILPFKTTGPAVRSIGSMDRLIVF